MKKFCINGPRNKNPLLKELFTSLQKDFKMLAGLQGYQYFLEMFKNDIVQVGQIYEFVKFIGAMVRTFFPNGFASQGVSIRIPLFG
jgi:hypothetical protein